MFPPNASPPAGLLPWKSPSPMSPLQSRKAFLRRQVFYGVPERSLPALCNSSMCWSNSACNNRYWVTSHDPTASGLMFPSPFNLWDCRKTGLSRSSIKGTASTSTEEQSPAEARPVSEPPWIGRRPQCEGTTHTNEKLSDPFEPWPFGEPVTRSQLSLFVLSGHLSGGNQTETCESQATNRQPRREDYLC